MQTPLPDQVRAFVAFTRSTSHSHEWMNLRCALARLVLHADALDRQSLRHALDCLQLEESLSAGYRRSCWARWLRFLRWAVEHEHASAELLVHATSWRPRFRDPQPPDDLEHPPRKASGAQLSAEAFQATIPLLTRLTRDLVELLALTGARPAEILILRTCDIERSDGHHIARPSRHKTAHLGHERTIALNRSAWFIIERRLKPFAPMDWLFPAPKDPRRHCSVNTASQQLRRVQKRLNLPRFTLYDLRRHSAQVVRQHAGLDTAQALLGHASIRTTEIYAPRLNELIVDAAEILDRENWS